jgi:hypothetical protein
VIVVGFKPFWKWDDHEHVSNPNWDIMSTFELKFFWETPWNIDPVGPAELDRSGPTHPRSCSKYTVVNIQKTIEDGDL